MPASIHSLLFDSSAKAVNATIGPVNPSWRMSLVDWMPSIFGIWISINTSRKWLDPVSNDFRTASSAS